MKKIIAVCSFLAVAASSSLALAGSTTTTFTATATTIPNCKIQSGATSINFGNYDPTAAADLTGAGSFTLRCTKGTPYYTYITGTRTMTDGTNNLSFELYPDTGYTGTYASIKPATPTGTTSSSAPVEITYYGKVASNQDVPVGAYATASPLTMNLEW